MNEDVIEAMESHKDLFVTAGEIAEEIGVTSTTVNERLHELKEEGKVERKEVRKLCFISPTTISFTPRDTK